MAQRLEHPYRSLTGGRWLRGNLHTHTTASDGERPMQVVLDDYAGRGYDFLAITDHDIYSGSATYAPYDARGMILIPGNEISRNGPHLLHLNGDRLIEPHRLRQRVFDEIAHCGGFAVANHPNWQEHFDHCSIARLQEWIGYAGLEIYNGVVAQLTGSAYALDKWDMLLHAGRRLWGFANDDSHYVEGNVGLGWNVAYVTERSAAGVARALESGRFYPSTGVILSDIEVQGLTIRMRTENAQRIVAVRDCGRRFQIADSAAIEVRVPPEARYVRLECWGPGESFAWTQPFFVVEEDSVEGDTYVAQVEQGD